MNRDRPLNCVLVTIGSAGDVHPFVGLGLALQRRGHRVTIVTGNYFEPLIHSAGLAFVSLFDSDHYRSMLDSPDLWHPLRGPKFVLQNAMLPMVRPTYDIIRRLHEPGRTIVAASSLALGARIAQEKHGIPTATIHLQPAVIRSVIRPPRLAGMATADWLPRSLIRAQYWLADRLVVDRIFEQQWNGFRREVGLPPVRRVFHGYIHGPKRTIGLFPDWFCPPEADWPKSVRLTGFPLYDEHDVSPRDEELERFLSSGEAPLVFTPGSAMTHGRNFFTAAAEGCARFGRRGLLLTRHVEQLPTTLPRSVRHVPYAPFSQLLPRCAAIVHHGGIGTTAQAFAAGIPQLIVPMSHDQFDNAARVAQCGTGVSISRKDFDAGRGADIIENLLSEEKVRAACRLYAEKLAACSALDDSARLLEGIDDEMTD